MALPHRATSERVKILTPDDGVGPGEDTLVHADRAGRIWFATKIACGVWEGTRFRAVDPGGGERVHLAPSRDGSMWATRGEKLLRYLPDGTREDIADIGQLGGAVEINTLYEDGGGTLWLGTRGMGLLRFDGGSFSRVGTSHQNVQAIFEGREGYLWAGTTAGLNRLGPQRFFLRGAAEGILKEGILSLCEDTKGRLWLAARDSAPLRAVDASNRAFAAPAGWPGGSLLAMCRDPSGGVWMGLASGAVRHWVDGAYTRSGPGLQVSTLLCDRSGNVWIGTIDGGLVRLRDGQGTTEPQEAGLHLVRALVEDADGAVWAGTENGLLFRRQGDRFKRVPLPETKGGESIRFLVRDGDAVWIGARDAGLFRWRAGKVERLREDAGLAIHDPRALAITPDGTFWLALGRDLFRTSRQDLEEVLGGKQRSLRGVRYGRGEGLPKVGFTFGRRNASVCTRDGHVWFATDRGPLEVDPEPLPQSPQLLPVLVEEASVGQQPIPLSQGAPIVLPPKPGPLQIRYSVPSLSAPERLRFRYRLAGLEDVWTRAGNERTATYTRLPPGHYRLEVAVSESDNPDSPSATSVLPVIVQAAWWETGLFRLSAGLLAAVTVTALVRMIVLWRVRTRLRRLEQEHALEKERARIARDMHDDLGASLTRLALLSELAADEPEMQGAATTKLREIAQAARSISGTLDQIVWTVNPRNDTLDRLVGYLAEFAGEYLAPTGLSLHLDLPAEMPAQTVAPEMRHEVLLAAKEALNNVVKHAGARAVRLQIGLERQTLRIVIADDGRGFDPQSIAAFSNGVLDLRHRLEELGGSTDVQSGLGAGTAMTLRVPLTWKTKTPQVARLRLDRAAGVAMVREAP